MCVQCASTARTPTIRVLRGKRPASRAGTNSRGRWSPRHGSRELGRCRFRFAFRGMSDDRSRLETRLCRPGGELRAWSAVCCAVLISMPIAASWSVTRSGTRWLWRSTTASRHGSWIEPTRPSAHCTSPPPTLSNLTATAQSEAPTICTPTSWCRSGRRSGWRVRVPTSSP